MRHVALGLTLVMGCTAVVGSVGDDTPASTDESGCFSQNTLPFADQFTVSWASGLGDQTYDIVPLGDDVILMGGFFDPAVFRGPGGTPVTLPAITGSTSRRTFVARIAADGSFRWAADLPSRRVNIEPHLAVAADGSVYAAGLFEGAFDFDPTSATDVRTPSSTTDVYVTKYAADGTYQWTQTWVAKPASVGEYDEPLVLAMPDGSVFVSDRWASPAITKLAADGSIAFVKASGHETVSALAVAADGSLLVGFHDTAAVGIGRYDATLTQIDQQVFEALLGIQGISELGDGRRIIAGTFSTEADFAPGAAIETRTSNGNMDAYVASYAPDGSLQWVNTFGSRGNDRIWKLARGLDGDIFAGGGFYKTVDFDPSAVGVDERTSRRQDAMTVEYAADGSYRGVRTWGGTDQDRVLALAVTAGGVVFAAGTNESTVNFGATTPDVRQSAGHDDGFVVALAPSTNVAASGAACLPTTQPAPVSAALAGTSLPQSFAECEALDTSHVLYGEEGDGRCWFSVAKSANPTQFAECQNAGGGISVAEYPAEEYYCEIIYDESAGACFGNYCD